MPKTCWNCVFRFVKKHLSWMLLRWCSRVGSGSQRWALQVRVKGQSNLQGTDSSVWLLQVYANFSTPPSSQGNATDHSMRINSVGSSTSSTQPLLVREDVWVVPGRREAQVYSLFVLCRGWEREDFNNFSYFYSLLPLCSWNVIVILFFTTHCFT